jgi:hypothetical protein
MEQGHGPPSDAPRSGERWAEFELRAAIREYFGLLEADLDGRPAEKAAAWRRVMADAPARTRGSVEYRFQNISHVFDGLGYRWVRGYPPAANTGHDLPPVVLEELGRRPELEARLKAMNDESAPPAELSAEGSPTLEAETASDQPAQEPAELLPVNAYLAELLAWHAHTQGGVSVPFRGRGRPLGQTVETTLYANLKRAAEAITASEPGPRWIFLVGGPGNGKSQMVEEFARFLDSASPGAGLLAELQQAFAADPIPRRVDITISGAGHGEWALQHLTIIQDASSSDRADGDAAALLVDDLEELLSRANPAGHVFVCSANRGLLARAVRASSSSSVARDLIREVFRWTGLGEEALRDPKHNTWPLAVDGIEPRLIGAWPLDTESLLLGEPAPFTQLIEEATKEEHWEAAACGACPSRPLCPLLANAKALRDQPVANALIRVLRRAELASGQRINFRMAFSLVAELLVGDASDFVDAPDRTACGWVHSRVAIAPEDTKRGVAAVAELMAHQYQFALVPLPIIDPRALYSEDATTAGAPMASEVFRGVEGAETTRAGRALTPIRELLRDSVSSVIDPVAWSPTQPGDPLRVAEDAFAQGVREGVGQWPAIAPPTALQSRLLEQLGRAEEEAEARFVAVGRIAAQRVTAAARVAAATIAKRSIGVRLGITSENELLAAYETAIRNAPDLLALRSTLKDLIGNQAFTADALAGFGSVDSLGPKAMLRALPMAIAQVLPAPTLSYERAAHDLPVVLVELQPAPNARYRPMPLTFALFRALKLFESGAANASLPASVRASLAELGQAYASHASRNEQALRNRDNDFAILSVGGDEIARFVLPADGGDVLVPEVS